MHCYYCGKDACSKVGGAKGNIWKALLGRKVWDKSEKYVCRECYDTIEKLGGYNSGNDWYMKEREKEAMK